MKKKYNNWPVGIAVGIISPLIILFGVNIYEFPDLSFITYLRTGFITGVISPYLKIATLFNLAPFYLFINTNRLLSARGILLATIVYGIVIAYLTFR